MPVPPASPCPSISLPCASMSRSPSAYPHYGLFGIVSFCTPSVQRRNQGPQGIGGASLIPGLRSLKTSVFLQVVLVGVGGRLPGLAWTLGRKPLWMIVHMRT